MHVGHHRGDPAHVVVLAQRAVLAGQQLADIALHRLFPVALVGHVDGEFGGALRNAEVLVGKHEAAQLTIQGEAHHAVAESQNQHGLRAVDGVAGGNLLGPRLQEGFLAECVVLTETGIRAAQHGEDGADRDVDVDIARAVQRVEDQQIGTLRVLAGNLVGVVHFLGRHAGQVAAPLVCLQQDFVGEHVELLLHFALDVLAVGATQYAPEGALGYRVADFLARSCHDLDEKAQISRRVVTASLLDEVATEGYA